MSTDKFIKKAKAIHGNQFDYSNVNYINAKKPVEICCPIHGIFFQRPELHINRKCICPSCSYTLRGRKRKLKNNWWTYSKSKKFVNELDLHSIKEWKEYCKSGSRPKQLPLAPKVTYKNEWEGWGSWIGYNGRTKNFLNFEEARKIARTFNIRSFEDWVHFSTKGGRPINIPFMPKQIYESEWISWGDWLGYESRANGNLHGIVYILQYEDLPNNVYKIGRTYRLEKRLAEHQRVNKIKIKVIKTFDVPIMSIGETKAIDIALSCGRRFKYKKSTEHFEINDINSFLLQCQKEFNNKK